MKKRNTINLGLKNIIFICKRCNNYNTIIQDNNILNKIKKDSNKEQNIINYEEYNSSNSNYLDQNKIQLCIYCGNPNYIYK